MYHIGFIVEQALGHRTHGQNLQALVPDDPEIAAYWGLPAWEDGDLVSRIPVLKNNWTLRAGWQSRRMLTRFSRQAHLDGLFFHTQVTAVLSPDWLARYPTIVSLDATPLQYDSLGDFYNHQSGPIWFERLKWRLTRDCFRKSRQLVTWSEWARQGLVDYDIDPEKATVIPPGVDIEAWTRPTDRQGTEDVVKILFVGANLERKGGLLLLNAFRVLRQQASIHGSQGLPSIELHLVTRDTVAAEPGLFVYNDMQPNSSALKCLYHESDIFCLPTDGDCLPMVLSEAGAAGLPAVSTRVAAIPEIIEDGETGFLIPAGDEAALVAALRRLVGDPELRRNQGRQAEVAIRRNFDAGRNASRLLSLLKDTINEAASGAGANYSPERPRGQTS